MPAPPDLALDPLPPPGSDERAHSGQLVGVIQREIATAGSAIGFARFMELALHAPGLGYYSAGKQKFGGTGDFVTAPELGSVYARLLARACTPVLARSSGDILEAGAGSGRLAADLLRALATIGALPETYYILELSADLRARQAATLAEHAPELAARARWLDRLPAHFRGVVIGNELLDAMPVERFVVRADGIKQLTVVTHGDGFATSERPADAATVARIEPLGLPAGYTSEINFAAEAWVRSVADILDAGLVLLIDYGFPRAEFYHPERRMGTLMCHYRHRAHPDPLILVGLQDITAHVDFSAIAEAARAGGLEVSGYTSQAAFLIGSGLDQIVADSDLADPRAHLALTGEIKKLTAPHEMGELHKVIGLGRGVDIYLPGFALADRRGRL